MSPTLIYECEKKYNDKSLYKDGSITYPVVITYHTDRNLYFVI